MSTRVIAKLDCAKETPDGVSVELFLLMRRDL